jgi:sterol desaturase/sphingolipid hydroxylase (fatty acid hydroxylase superfamily)
MEEILGPVIPLSFLVMLVVEHFFAARSLPKVRFWLLQGLLFFSFTGVVNALLPALLARLLAGHTLFDLRGLGIVPGALLGALVADFFGYWLHRAMHNVHWLWRWTHQMHHSAERMDLAGMSYTHPFDTLLTFSLVGLATALLGLSPDAAALAGFLGYVTAVAQHMNIRTPRWIGRIVMRPEAHGLHHERGIHAYNYASFPLWDIVFGTFRHVQDFPEQYGFWQGASSQLGPMLIGRDVGEPSAPAARGATKRA